MASVAVIALVVAAAAGGAAAAAAMAKKPHAVKQPPVPPPPPIPEIGRRDISRRRPKHGTGRTILTGDLRPSESQVAKKQLLGAER
jgi:hypothetical protein